MLLTLSRQIASETNVTRDKRHLSKYDGEEEGIGTVIVVTLLNVLV